MFKDIKVLEKNKVIEFYGSVIEMKPLSVVDEVSVGRNTTKEIASLQEGLIKAKKEAEKLEEEVIEDPYNSVDVRYLFDSLSRIHRVAGSIVSVDGVSKEHVDKVLELKKLPSRIFEELFLHFIEVNSLIPDLEKDSGKSN